VLARQRLAVGVGPDPDHHLVAVDAEAHVAAHHERKPAEHLLLRHIAPPVEEPPDTLC
jgi:hypothetical protein